jgi:hypothetical protein
LDHFTVNSVRAAWGRRWMGRILFKEHVGTKECPYSWTSLVNSKNIHDYSQKGKKKSWPKRVYQA